MKVAVTGAGGFIGRNLVARLQRVDDYDVTVVPRDADVATLAALLGGVDALFHLAGVNRPTDNDDFQRVNVGYTAELLDVLKDVAPQCRVVFASSVQAAAANPYGESKRQAEELLHRFASAGSGRSVAIFRLPNVFGKWSHPNYNSVVATFCHNLTRGIDLTINDPDAPVEFVYIDDVVDAMIHNARDRDTTPDVQPRFPTTVGALADRLRMLFACIQSNTIPDLSDPFSKALLSTLLWFVGPALACVPVQVKTDDRGWLFELLRSKNAGQVFVSSTRPGVTRGNHYHDTKIEKFCLVTGRACIRFRDIMTGERSEVHVSEDDRHVVHIPPGVTHSVTNTGSTDMVMVFWANEPFNRAAPDTYYEEVDP